MITQLEHAARAAGEKLVALQHSGLSRFGKGGFDFATEADIAAQEIVLRCLERDFPGTPVLAEEQETHTIPNGSFFSVDPLDGTIGYAYGADSWGVLIAFFEDGVPKAGLVHMPATGRVLIAEKGKGAKIDGRQVALRRVDALSQAILGVDLGAWMPAGIRRKYVDPLIEQVICARSLTSSAASTMELCSGVSSVYISPYGGKVWDLAPAFVAVTEAGGVALDPDGSPPAWDRVLTRGLFAASDSLGAQALLAIHPRNS